MTTTLTGLALVATLVVFPIHPFRHYFTPPFSGFPMNRKSLSV